MRKEKDMNLVNIYIKIHNKQVLTMDDLAYLAKYNPECFKKTCDNLIYKVPEAKKLVKSPQEAPPPETKQNSVPEPVGAHFDAMAGDQLQDRRTILQFLENMRKIEASEANSLQNINLDQVKDLMGNLFMENLFPHNGMQGYFDVHEKDSTFNVRV